MSPRPTVERPTTSADAYRRFVADDDLEATIRRYVDDLHGGGAFQHAEDLSEAHLRS